MKTRDVLIGVLSGLLALILVSSGCADDGEDGTQTPAPDALGDALADGVLPPPPLDCQSNTDCSALEGTDACRIGVCNLAIGKCEVFEKPNCCVGNEDCDDGVSATTDYCDAALGVCKHADETKPCTSPSDCISEDVCVKFLCEDFVCTFWQDPACCISKNDCDDGDFCTVDMCTNFKCAYAESDDPLCCGEVVVSYDFTDEIPGTFTIEGNGQPTAWHHSMSRHHTLGGSARFANAKDGSYANPVTDTGIVASVGSLSTGPIALPEGELSLSFWLFFDMELLPDYDLFELQAIADGQPVMLWNKNGLGEAQLQTWIQVTLDLSELAGKTVQLVWSVDTIDGTENSREGVFIDDVAVVKGCEAPPPCTSDKDCDDGNPCTEDACGEEGLCGHSAADGCCLNGSDCGPPPSDCFAFVGCEQNQCKYEPLPGCCQSDADCDDKDPCTLDICAAGGNCEFAELPDCCTPEALYQAAFPPGDDGQVNIENGSPNGGWNVSELQSHSPPRALQYGDPQAGHYDFGGASMGVAWLPWLDLPAGQAADLRFWAYLDIESFPQADLLEVRVHTDSGEEVVTWSKDKLDADSYKTWVQIQVDLSAFAGSAVEIGFLFDTVDAIDNDGEGVFIDDILVGTGCGSVGCTEDWECEDGEKCTIDTCGDDGKCHHVWDPDCGCTGPWDCDDGDPCTLDFCQNGACGFEPDPTCQCQGDWQCNDGDECTIDQCGDNGKCYYTPNPECGCQTSMDCDDGDICTADFCVQGECQHVGVPLPECMGECSTVKDCDDKDPCTADFCVNGTCQHAKIPDCGGECQGPWDCDDGDKCTSDFCIDGVCENIPIPGCGLECTGSWQCDDGNDCTEDVCSDNGKCMYLEIPNCPSECTSAWQCEDGDTCTSDFCVEGTCQSIPIPGCVTPDCKKDSDCVASNPCAVGACVGGKCQFEIMECWDGDPCTNDVCQNGACIFLPIPGCPSECDGPWDCEDGNPCTADFCLSGKCENLPIPGCGVGCQSAADCADAGPCTDKGCVNGQCTWKLAAGCLVCKNLASAFQDNFDSSLGGSGWKMSAPMSGVGWKIGSFGGFASSKPNALYYGDPATLSYAGEGKNSGTATSPPFAIPETVKSLTLTFEVLAEIEGGASYDKLDLWVLAPSGDKLVWDKSSLYDTSGDNWNSMKVELSGLAGQVVQLQFRFDTVDAIANNTLGVFVDDIAVVQWCGSTACDPSDPSACNDGSACTQDLCTDSGECVNLPLPNCCISVADCDAGPPCTSAACVYSGAVGYGKCAYKDVPNCCTQASECNDSDKCTADFCISQKCVHQPIPGCGGCDPDDPAACNDSNPCTNDYCSASGTCVSKPIPGCCTSNAQCADGPPCTKGACLISGPAGYGKCIYNEIPNCCTQASECDDSNPCTVDFCGPDGQCIHVGNPNCCKSDSECADDNPCTKDVCSANGQCAHLPMPGCCVSATQCDDGNPCTVNGCSQNQCVFKIIPNCCTSVADCPKDNNPCTLESCQKNQCVVEKDPTCCSSDTQCNDSNPCTKDQCLGGKCFSSPIAQCCTQNAQCNDGNACTKDVCEKNHCTTTTIPGCCTADNQCDDGNSCTSDGCVGNACVSKPSGAPGCCATTKECDDGDPCTSNACVSFHCETKAVAGCCKLSFECNDTNPCTKDGCVGNQCVHEAVPGCCKSDTDCQDPSPCTLDTCDVATGTCQYQQVPGCCLSDAQCDDSEPCTMDACVALKCTNTKITECCKTAADCPDKECQSATCSANACQYKPLAGCCSSDAQCNDGNPCTSDQCTNGSCKSTTIPGCCTSDADCDDANPCTVEACGSDGCQYKPVSGCCTSAAECSDGDECTIDGCKANQCVHEEDPNCCKEQVILSENFEDGEAQGWEIDAEGQAFWQVSKAKAHSKPVAAWFGNPLTGDYSTEGGPSKGAATSPVLNLPAAPAVVVQFWLWLDVEQVGSYDKLELVVLSMDSSKDPLVWDKTALDSDEYKSWVPVKVNLSAWAGQPIQLQFGFDSVDGIENGGQGVFVDDIVIESFCEPVSICVFDSECDDGQQCTSDECVGGACKYSVIPDCCQSDAECDDAYLCTADWCSDEGSCQHEMKEGCCQYDGECADDNPCTKDTCAGNACQNVPISGAGCCKTAADCDDSDPCTKDYCDESTCQYLADPGPGCCEPEVLLDASFDDATMDGFTTIDDGSGAKWSVQGKRHMSPPFSLYFGILGAWNYETEPPTSGVAISPQLSVPLKSAGAKLTFQTWVDIGGGFGGFGDVYQVRVLSGSTLKTVWTASTSPAAMGKWQAASVDLAEYKGKTVQLYFDFTASNAPWGDGGGEGIYLDDVVVQTYCEP